MASLIGGTTRGRARPMAPMRQLNMTTGSWCIALRKKFDIGRVSGSKASLTAETQGF